jgi:hypothetical protein
VNDRFSKLISHEIALWYRKMAILDVCWKTPISQYVPYERRGLVTTALKTRNLHYMIIKQPQTQF